MARNANCRYVGLLRYEGTKREKEKEMYILGHIRVSIPAGTPRIFIRVHFATKFTSATKETRLFQYTFLAHVFSSFSQTIFRNPQSSLSNQIVKTNVAYAFEIFY